MASASPFHQTTSAVRRTIAARDGHLHVEPTPIHFRIFRKVQSHGEDADEPNAADLLMESKNAFLVWESQASSPRVAFRREDVRFADGSSEGGVGLRESAEQKPDKPPSPLASTYYDLTLGDKAGVYSTLAAWTFARDTPLTEHTPSDAPPPDDLFVLQADRFPQVWEEGSVQIGNVRNPYHRVDLVPTRRSVQVYAIGRDGKSRILLADTSATRAPQRSFALFETGLATRWYVPSSAVEVALKQTKGLHLDPAAGAKTSEYADDGLMTVCPYKGFARYHTITLPDGDTLKNIAWAYPEAISAFDARGLIAFWVPGNERLRVVVDGQEA